MNKKLCISKRIKGVDARVDYYLLESTYRDIKDGVYTYVFGVEIEKVSQDESGVENVQKKYIADLSVCKERVIQFLYLLAENDVLPVTLKNIAEDFAGEGFFHEVLLKKKIA